MLDRVAHRCSAATIRLIAGRAMPVALALSMSCAVPAFGQGDPLGEPFPAVFGTRDLRGDIGLTIDGFVDDDGVGLSVSSAGDVNGDGISDLIIGAGSTVIGPSPVNACYVVFGGPDGPEIDNLEQLDGTSGFRIQGVDTSGFVEVSVAGVGDLNGDGIDDVVASSGHADYGSQANIGAAYVIFGRDPSAAFPPVIDVADLDGQIGFVFRGRLGGDRLGNAVSRAGDINGDGLPDMLVGAVAASPPGRTNAGVAYVVFGRPESEPFPATLWAFSLNGQNGFAVRGAAAGDQFGRSVAAAGDVNGDGIDDVVIGASGASPGGRMRTGASYIVFGRAPGSPFPADVEVGQLDGGDGFRLEGISRYDRSGVAVSGAGDFNGDGFEDVYIGAANAYRGYRPYLYSSGEGYIVLGRDVASTGPFPPSIPLADLDGTNGTVLDGRSTYGLIGHAVASAGDLNGDGLDDVAVGAPTLFGGAIYVIFGRIGPLPAAIDLDRLNGEDGFLMIGGTFEERCGWSVAAAGDINDDGRDDLIGGGPDIQQFGRPSGQAYVLYGRDLFRCAADLDGDGDLTLFDFLEFQSLFDAGDVRADFDGDGDLTLFDFLAYQNAFAAGCA